MSEITLGQLIYETEAHYHRYTPRWDNCAHDVKAAFEAAGAKVQECVRAESASEIERLREALTCLTMAAINIDAVHETAGPYSAELRAAIVRAYTALSTPKESLPVEEGK